MNRARNFYIFHESLAATYGFVTPNIFPNKSRYDHSDAASPQPKPNYGEKPSLYKTELEVEAELEHGAKSEEGEAKPSTGYSKPRPEGETKPEYGEKQGVYMPKLEVEVEAEVMVQLQSTARASAKVKCVAVDEVGLEKTVPICSVVTDAKGYFFTTVSALNLKDCKAFLEKSPLGSCNVQTDVNKGISGVPFQAIVF
ncbi:hypothetical protein PVK06_017705 [Gossypium arboreum]|uniref:Uncharacterized protein n=1 Tax=Gossypium arboreum TaxID=29729 RepID=A0ABR0Q477_GOSAR|nr:hypothetical protein PVK06_017705 [Gossypium arboreum]